MYAKIENGTFIIAPRKLLIDRTVVYNPSEAMLLANGYKPVVYTDMPETEPGFYAESSWVDGGTSIKQVWTIVEETADVDISDEEAFSIIMGVDQ